MYEPRNSEYPTVYVLVHGAYHGGWCWRDVADILRAQGHDVFTPTLTGLGERAHQLALGPGLETMIEDIVQVIECEELRDVVLVGHSFSGLVISGVADRIKDRIRHLVYLDALVLPGGSAVLDKASEESRAYYTSLRIENGGSGGIPVPPVDFFAVAPGEQEQWLTRRLTPHPVQAFFDKLVLRNPLGNGLSATYIVCTDPYFVPTESSRALAATIPGCRFIDIATGHDAMISAPRELAALLAGI
jgi:pimeloyl-ACP methyl ester carboxylesterase